MDISEGKPAGGPFFPGQPGLSGVISVIKSRLSGPEITKRFQEMSQGLLPQKEMDDKSSVYPVMVFKIDPGTFNYNSDMGYFLDWGETFREILNQEATGEDPSVSHLSLDDLLDLVKSKGGFENLTTLEQERLKKLSQ